jgi:RNA polymerase sigma factor (sigma-70 family)
VEASAIPASVGLARTRIALGAPLLRIRSDEQLVSLFRGGSEDAFRVIHDRYRQRMFAYTRQMLAGSPADAEDAVQEIFVRAYAGLRASHRQLALRAWLYRIAHNRCIDELRRPQAAPTDEIPAATANAGSDPAARLEQREALRRLIADVQRLPEQQRSALLMRELAGMTYADVSGALGVSVPAVKSLLVRARVGLAAANEARDTACARIREDMIVAYDRGVRASGLTRRHLRDCPSCRQFRSEVRGVSRQLAAFVPALGPLGVIAKLLGVGGAGGGGAAAGSGAVAGGGATAATAAATGLAGGGAAASVGAIAGASHVVTILAAAVVTAGGALELQHIAPPPAAHHTRHHHVTAHTPPPARYVAGTPSGGTGSSGPVASTIPAVPAASSSPAATATGEPGSYQSSATSAPAHGKSKFTRPATLPLTETADPDNMTYANGAATSTTPTTATSGTTSAAATGAVTPIGSSTTAGPTGSAGTTTTTTTTTPGASASTTPAQTSTGTAGAATGSSGTTGTPAATAGTGTTPVTTTQDGSATAAIPATSTSPSGAAAPTRTVKPGKHSGAIAVFTVTGS